MRRTTDATSTPEGVATIGDSMANRVEIHDPTVTTDTALDWTFFVHVNGEMVGDFRVADAHVPAESASALQRLSERAAHGIGQPIIKALNHVERGNYCRALVKALKARQNAVSIIEDWGL